MKGWHRTKKQCDNTDRHLTAPGGCDEGAVGILAGGLKAKW